MRIIMYFFLIGGGVIAPAFMFYLWCKDQHLKELLITFVMRLREHLRLERPIMALKMAICDAYDERVYLCKQELQQVREEMLGYHAEDPICEYTMMRLKYGSALEQLYAAEAERDRALENLQ